MLCCLSKAGNVADTKQLTWLCTPDALISVPWVSKHECGISDYWLNVWWKNTILFKKIFFSIPKYYFNLRGNFLYAKIILGCRNMICKREEEISDQFNHLKGIGIWVFCFLWENSAKNNFSGIFPAQGSILPILSSQNAIFVMTKFVSEDLKMPNKQ